MKIHLIAPTKKGETYLFNKGLLAPLGLMYLAAYTPEDAEVRIIDENVERIDFEGKPDLVGISTMTATAPRAYQIADRYRELGIKVVLGGVHASMVPEEASRHADSVVIGEAESIWPKVVSDADSGRLDPVYRQEGFPDFKRPRMPRRDVIDPKRYWNANGVQTSRGCPYDCNFCSVTVFNGRRPRVRDLDNILEEIESLSRTNIVRKKVVPFVDDNIAANKKLAKEFFKALIPMKILWGSQASITFAKDEELVELAAESGCRFLFIGLETLEPGSLAEMGKKQNKSWEYEAALRLLKKHKIGVMGAFIFGFDSDKETVFKTTLDFAVNSRIPIAQFANLTPYPGTRLYARLLEENRVEPDFWLDETWNNRVVFDPANMNAERLHQQTAQVYRDFYSYKTILKRMSVRKHWQYWFAFNLLYRQTVYSARSSDVITPGGPAVGTA